MKLDVTEFNDAQSSRLTPDGLTQWPWGHQRGRLKPNEIIKGVKGAVWLLVCELNVKFINVLAGILVRARDINNTLFSHSNVLWCSHWQLVTVRPSRSLTHALPLTWANLTHEFRHCVQEKYFYQNARRYLYPQHNGALVGPLVLDLSTRTPTEQMSFLDIWVW